MVRSDKACIFLNGEPPGRDHIERYCEPAYLKICTDGAHDYLEAYGVSPHILIGDMDSLKELPSGSAFRILRSTDVNNSDFEKALGYCSDNGIRKLRIFGAGGGRVDHFLINIALMIRSAQKMDIDMITRGEYLRFLRPGSYRMGGKAGQRFSLLSLNTAKDLSLQGAAYYFSHADLEMGSRGLSNAFSGNALEISFSEGLLLYMTELK